MPYANNQGVRIYYEVEGQGPPLVLLHGVNMSLEHWRVLGMVEALKSDFRLILIDTRGHGRSDKPHDPDAFKVSALVADVTAVLGDLGISRAHHLGYSMGAMIGLGAARFAPERFHCLILGGCNLPINRNPELPGRVIELFKYKQGMEAFLALSETMLGQWWTPEVKAILQSNDLEGIIALLSAQDGILVQDLEDLLPAVALPCLCYEGEDDDYNLASEIARRIPNATFVSFPGLDHCGAYYRIDLVLPHVRQFLAEVGQP